jgi:hypothetical protein
MLQMRSVAGPPKFPPFEVGVEGKSVTEEEQWRNAGPLCNPVSTRLVDRFFSTSYKVFWISFRSCL